MPIFLKKPAHEEPLKVVSIPSNMLELTNLRRGHRLSDEAGEDDGGDDLEKEEDSESEPKEEEEAEEDEENL